MPGDIVPCRHIAGAEPEHGHDRRKNAEDGDESEHRPRCRRRTRRLERGLHRLCEAPRDEALIGEGLQRANRADLLAGIGRRLCQRVLRLPRLRPHRSAEGHERQHDDRDCRDHQAGKLGARVDHHGECTQTQQHIAQRYGSGGADGGFDLRRVGGQSRQDLTRLRAIEEGGRQGRHMREHVASYIRHDAFAEGYDEIIAAG